MCSVCGRGCRGGGIVNDELRRVKLERAVQAAKRALSSMPGELLPVGCFGAMPRQRAAPPAVEELKAELLCEADGVKASDCDRRLEELLDRIDGELERYRRHLEQLAKCAECTLFERCRALSR